MILEDLKPEEIGPLKLAKFIRKGEIKELEIRV